MNYKSTGTGLSCCRVGLFRVTTRHRIDCFSIVLLFLAIDQQKCLLFLRNPTQKKKKTKRNGCATIFVKSQMHILVLSYIKSSTRKRSPKHFFTFNNIFCTGQDSAPLLIQLPTSCRRFKTWAFLHVFHKKSASFWFTLCFTFIRNYPMYRNFFRAVIMRSTSKRHFWQRTKDSSCTCWPVPALRH